MESARKALGYKRTDSSGRDRLSRYLESHDSDVNISINDRRIGGKLKEPESITTQAYEVR